MHTVGYIYKTQHWAECPRCKERYTRNTEWEINLIMRLHDLIKHGVPFDAEAEE